METLRKQLPFPLSIYARLLVAAIFLYHGFPKAVYWGWASEIFMNMGFPAFMGPAIGLVEVAGAVALLIGYQVRLASLVLIAVMAGAIATVQAPGAIAQGAFTCGLERDLLIAGLCGYLFLGER